MKAIRLSFLQLLHFIRQDMMLLAACLTPIFAGCFFKFGVPTLERILTSWLHLPYVLVPYYGLFDLFFSFLGAMMFCFAAAMVILEERDDHIAKYLFVTTLGPKGYLIARLGLPATMAFVLTACLLPFFKLTDLSVTACLFLSAVAALQGLIIALFIVTISTNKLEGMAVAKVATLILLGGFGPYFISGKIQYLLSLLPSYWMGKFMYETAAAWLLPAFFISLVWVGILQKIFVRRLTQ